MELAMSRRCGPSETPAIVSSFMQFCNDTMSRWREILRDQRGRHSVSYDFMQTNRCRSAFLGQLLCIGQVAARAPWW